MKIANRDARSFVQRLHPFQGNNLYAGYWCANPSSANPGDSGYVVYSYHNDWPLFVCIHLDGRDRWFENRDKISVTTSKHRSQAQQLPPEGTTFMSREDMVTLVRKGLTHLTALKLDPLPQLPHGARMTGLPTHVWVVESLAEDSPTLLSVHTDRESANAARDAYIKDYRHGGIQSDYWVHTMKLNFTGLENDE